ncbi:MAG TPA: YodL domain-containing protein [Spirochaetia bacterium]|nr:YodL domain-containing protein [Spirochaetales bacterium]HQH66344.1 YodL domain-containing protein [Clostridia bacterium]HQK34354.1 YodL domain-containing protein [Spirochaetales bacterium]HRS64903.1 YodL domain-containing protein [Spirochaetia bacterium]
MNGIQIKNNRILYYGNTAGYIEKGRAIVDPMFQNEELRSFLTERKGLELEWRNGTFARLAEGKVDPEGNLQVLKKCRVHQLKPNVDVMMKFIGYDELLERFGEPAPDNYRVVYDGEVETNDLEELFAKFNLDHPPGYEGHSLSMSDVVELYDESGSSFHYVDRFGFREISFQPPEQELYQGPAMSL